MELSLREGLVFTGLHRVCANAYLSRKIIIALAGRIPRNIPIGIFKIPINQPPRIKPNTIDGSPSKRSKGCRRK